MTGEKNSQPEQSQEGSYRLTVIGSGTCVPSARRGSPSLLIKEEEHLFLVDCGPGTMGKLARLGIGPEHIDALFLTHFHPDHVSDMIAFLFANNYGQPSRTADLTIAAAVGFKDFLKSLQDVFEHWLDPQNYNLRIIELTEDPIELQGIQIRNKRVRHSPVSLAYRFSNKEGKSIVVSGDTDYCPELVDLARDADLAVLECSFPDALKVEGHLSPHYAGKIAREAECRRLVLTHFYPPCDEADVLHECRKEFSGEIFLAEDFWEYNLDI